MELSTSGRDRTRRPRVVLAPEIAEIAGSVRTRLPDLVDRVVQRLLAEIEFYRDREVVSAQDLRDSVASNLESMVAHRGVIFEVMLAMLGFAPWSSKYLATSKWAVMMA